LLDASFYVPFAINIDDTRTRKVCPDRRIRRARPVEGHADANVGAAVHIVVHRARPALDRVGFRRSNRTFFRSLATARPSGCRPRAGCRERCWSWCRRSWACVCRRRGSEPHQDLAINHARQEGFGAQEQVRGQGGIIDQYTLIIADLLDDAVGDLAYFVLGSTRRILRWTGTHRPRRPDLRLVHSWS
jgi:hypothetical protein